MAGYIGTIPVPQATESRSVFTATSNQTTFATGGYTPNLVSVFLNGVHLARADFVATNGTDVVLAVGAAADDTVEILAFNAFEASSSAFTADVSTSGTFLPEGDTAAGDDAAVGYTAAEGLILTGQGSTNDVTIKNDADADVLEIPTGTVNVTMAGDLTVAGTLNATGDTAAGDDAAVGYASADGLVLTGQGTTSDVTIKNDADATVISIPTGTTGVTFAGTPTFPDGSINLADLDIDGGTDIGAALVDADLMIVDDGAGGTNRKATMARLATYMGTKVGGGMEFIASSGAISDGTASVAFTGFDASKYDHYKFYFQHLIPVTDGGGGALVARLSANGGGAYDATNGNYHYGGSDTTGLLATNENVGGDTNEYGVGGGFELYSPHVAAYTFSRQMSMCQRNDGAATPGTGASYHLSAATQNAIQFLFASGNIESGEITMFGIVNS